MPPRRRFPGRFRVYDRDELRILSVSSAAAILRARVTVEFDDGRFTHYEFEHTSNSNRTLKDDDFGLFGETPGTIVRAVVAPVTNLKRGQCFVELAIINQGRTMQLLAQGYIHDSNTIALDQFVEVGPGGGGGDTAYRTIADDIAPADITTTLAVTNALTRVDGFIWYYHCSGDIADRTLRVFFRNIGLGLPTGMTSGINTTPRAWPNSAALTLSANEEGMIFVNGAAKPAYSAFRDNGVITIENNASIPSPFPLWIREDDVAQLFFDVTDEEAADRHSIFLIQESWIDL